MKNLIKEDPNQLIDEIKHRVQTIDYLATDERNDILDYIAAKVKAEIWPFLRNARSVRRNKYPIWVEFQKLLKEFDLQDVLTRENNYEPLPEYIENHTDTRGVAELEWHIDYFRKLHEREDEYHEKYFELAFEEWAKPALYYAFERVDIKKSDKEIVRYISLTFYTEFVRIRAEYQGMRRKRRGDKWVYYFEKDINEFDFMHENVLNLIFHTEDQEKIPTLTELSKKLTKKQTALLIQVYNYVRDDVRELSTKEFYEKYPNERMSYKKIAGDMGYSYDSFVKNIQRMKSRIVQN
ncbi:hypothetical protein ACKA0G_29060 [Priestia megaterium]|uniref:hypothetical protein n=1 Tax=Priestia megaterium TaxID=1404 RepID=UPI0038B175FB